MLKSEKVCANPTNAEIGCLKKWKTRKSRFGLLKPGKNRGLKNPRTLKTCLRKNVCVQGGRERRKLNKKQGNTKVPEDQGVLALISAQKRDCGLTSFRSQ
jgi:hypothetical protein